MEIEEHQGLSVLRRQRLQRSLDEPPSILILERTGDPRLLPVHGAEGLSHGPAEAGHYVRVSAIASQRGVGYRVSARIVLAAFRPGAPMMPPPGCVADPHM